MPVSAIADEVVWNNPVGGDYFESSNWAGGQVPDAGDAVVFDLNSPGYTVESASDIESASLTVRNDHVTLSLGDGVWRTPQDNAYTMVVGNQGGDVGTLTLSSGTLETGRTAIGYTGNAHGTLIVDGATSHLALSNSALFAGGEDASQGTITVRNGATISVGGAVEPYFYIAPSKDSTGSVTVTGPGSRLEVAQFIYVGERGKGSLEILNSASVEARGLRIGGTTAVGNPAANGTALIQNSEAVFDGQIRLGGFGTGKLTLDDSTVINRDQAQIGSGLSTDFSIFGHGELTIKNGASLDSRVGQSSSTATSATIAAFVPESSGSVLVTGANSKWLQDGNFSVGSVGAASLRIEDQAYVESKDAQVARTATASADVQVDGEGSLWLTQDSLIIGGAFTTAGGEATVVVTNNGLVKVGQHLHLWQQGTLEVSQQGAVIVGESAASIASTVLIANGGTLSGTGTIIGDVLTDGGILSPGASPGVLHIDGNLTVAAGQLLIELGGLTAGTDYDQLDVTGSIFLDGLVQLSFINGFIPSVGDQFSLFQAGGEFNASLAQFNWLNAPSGLTYDSTLVDGIYTIQITAVPEPSSLVLASIAVLSGVVLWRRKPRKTSPHALAGT